MSTPLKRDDFAEAHDHDWQRSHADYCHRFEDGEACACGAKRNEHSILRDFNRVSSAWWHWGRAGCVTCEELMRQAELDPAALADEKLACREMSRQFEEGRE